MGALSYADDITLIAPSIGGLNEMLKLCDNYATVYNVIFNSKKTVCIKFGKQLFNCIFFLLLVLLLLCICICN